MKTYSATKSFDELASTSSAAMPDEIHSAPTGAPSELALRKIGGRSPAWDNVRLISAEKSKSELPVPKALIAAMTATSMPATGPRIGAIASAKGAPLLAARALGKSIRVATVDNR